MSPCSKKVWRARQEHISFAKALKVTVMHHQEGLELKIVWWLYHIHATCGIPAICRLFGMFIEVRDIIKNERYPETMPTTEHSHYGSAAHNTGHSDQQITFGAFFLHCFYQHVTWIGLIITGHQS